MHWTQQLVRIAERLRGIDADEPDAADLHYRRLTAQAACLLSQHWPSDHSLPRFVHPETGPELQADTQARETVWHLTWRILVESLRQSCPGEIPFAGSARSEPPQRLSESVVVFVATVHPDDARERARDAADVLEWLADRMKKTNRRNESTQPEAAAPQEQRWTKEKVSEHCQQAVEAWFDDCENAELRERAKFLLTAKSAAAIADQLGCDRKTVLYSDWFRTQRTTQAEAFLRYTHVPNARQSESL